MLEELQLKMKISGLSVDKLKRNGGRMAKKRVEIKSLKEGNFVLIDGKPCQIKNITTSAPGRHGHAKYRVKAEGLFDGKKRELVKPADSQVDVPIIDKEKAQVLNISGDTIQLMDLNTYETFETSLPKGRRGNISEGEEIRYWKVMGRKILKQGS